MSDVFVAHAELIRHASHNQKDHGRGRRGGRAVEAGALTGEESYRAGGAAHADNVKASGAIETAGQLTEAERQAVADELNAQEYGRIVGDLDASNQTIVDYGLHHKDLGEGFEEIPLGVRMQLNEADALLTVSYAASPGGSDARKEANRMGRALDDAMEAYRKDGDIAALSKGMEAATGVTPASALISSVNRQWARSSQSTVSEAMQLEVADARGDSSFNMQVTPTKGLSVPDSMGWLPSGSLVAAAGLRNSIPTSIKSVRVATERQTASVLKSSGIDPSDTVTLYRGSSGGTISPGYDTGTVSAGPSITTNPLSSWSESLDVAERFGGIDVVKVEVPASQIYGVSAWSGHGSLAEREVILYDDGGDFADYSVERAANATDEKRTINLDELDGDWIKSVRMPGTEDIPADERHASHNQLDHAGKGKGKKKGKKGKKKRKLTAQEKMVKALTSPQFGKGKPDASTVLIAGIGLDWLRSLDLTESPDATSLSHMATAATLLEVRHPGHSPQQVHAGKGAIKGLASDLAEPDGGFTADDMGAPITTGWSVGLEGSTTKIQVEDFLADSAAAEAAIADKLMSVPDGATGVGAWHDPDTGTIHIDHVKVFPSDQEAAATEFGVANNQISIANLDAITAGDWDHAIKDTGGTGDVDRAIIPDYETNQAPRIVRTQEEADAGRGRRTRREDLRRSLGQAEVFYAHAELITRHASHNQKTHGRKGGGGGGYGTGVRADGTLEVASLGSLDDVTRGKLEAKMADMFGGADGLAVMEANYTETAERLVAEGGLAENVANSKWYSNENAAASAKVDGFNNGAATDAPTLTTESYFGMVSVTSANKSWTSNKQFVDDWANTMSKDPKVKVTDEMVADYNNHVSSTRKSVNQTHDLPAGEYRLSDLPPDMVMPMSRHATNRQALADQGFATPGLRNFNDGTKMVMIARGSSPDTIIKGPKQRSFINNLTHPKSPVDVTHDIWDYRIAAGATPIKKGRVGTKTMSEWEAEGRSPQDVMQSGPGYTKNKVKIWDSQNGIYPLVTEASKSATNAFNEKHGTDMLPLEFQAMIWVGMGGDS